jgi:CubicO group peptidase (beta-lactamase class C family)
MVIIKMLPAIIVFTIVSGFTVPKEITINKEQLRSRIEVLAEKYNVPDYSIGIIFKDSLCFTLNRHIENEGKNYLIGSCSKSFTALAILKLVREGKVILDTPVRSYLPWFEMKDKSVTDSVTVRRLLNHKSGFERQQGFFDPKVKNASDYEDKMAVYIKSLKIRFSPGTSFQYCNLNYVLLGLIIRKVTGETYSDFMTDTVIPGTGMKSTYFTFKDNNEHNLMMGYQYCFCGFPIRSGLYRYSDFILPAGYISSNTSDLTDYLKFLLHKTVTSSGDTIITPDLMACLTGGNQPGYAMGWFNTFKDSLRIVRHTGLVENFASSLNMYPDLDLGWVVLCNVNSSEFCDKVDLEIQSIMLNEIKQGSPSFEKPVRWIISILSIVLLAALIINLARWKKAGFRFGFDTKTFPFVLLIAGIVLSAMPLIIVSKMFGIFISDMIRFSPDLGWGLIMIAVFGIAGSLARYFGLHSVKA